ncbi:siphovirus ReqiPepy6 Gp37-like family protein [Actinomadura madurae]|uniref:siphovirus ReqiPepy6 Gp37-like family protein n=1 Tax=Actinomadura madurae TaxID=1993 RepID=UPI0020D25B43|nr:siphovirus ReqiPepy6 Gp37-like family protein [Actinomadura madurae]MCP9964046.1 siphovirus ReqiPepy6 Gp37-like family protein [Actinomadura madurae]
MAVTVEPLTTDWKRLKPLPWVKLDINAVRYNQVGAFSLTVPATDVTWDLVEFDVDGVLKPKTGFYVDWNGIFDVPLKVEAANPSKTITEAGEIVETIVFSGSDFFSLLADRLVYRNATTTWDAQTVGSTTVTGKAETVIKDLVTANVVTAGDTDRRVPGFTVATDLERGGDVTYTIYIKDPAAEPGEDKTSTAGESLMDMIRAVARQSDIGVSLELVDEELVFDCFIPRDLTEKVVFSERYGSLRSWSINDATPTANAILMQTAAVATPSPRRPAPAPPTHGGASNTMSTNPPRPRPHRSPRRSSTRSRAVPRRLVWRSPCRTSPGCGSARMPPASRATASVTWSPPTSATASPTPTRSPPCSSPRTPTSPRTWRPSSRPWVTTTPGVGTTPDDASAIAQLSARVRQLEQQLRSRA